MEGNIANAPPGQSRNHQEDYPHHHDLNHNGDDKVINVEVPKNPSHDHDPDNSIHLESPTNPSHDDEQKHNINDAKDVHLESPMKPIHDDDDVVDRSPDDDIDLKSPTKPTHDADDDVEDLESGMKGITEGGCNSLAVVDSRFCSSSAMDLVMAANGRCRSKKYSISKGGNETNKELLLQLDQRACLPNLMGKYYMVDQNNQPVLCIKRKVKGFLRNERQVFSGHDFKDGGELFRIRRSRFLQLKTTLDVYLQNNMKQENDDENIQKDIQHPSPDYVVKVSWLGSSIDVFHGSKAIAQVRRKSTGWLRKKTFSCSLQSEVDYSFIVALTIIADSIYKEYTLSIFIAIIDLMVSISDFLPSIV